MWHRVKIRKKRTDFRNQTIRHNMSASNRPNALNFVKKSDMIQELLTDMEMEAKYTIYAEQKNLEAVKNLRELLNQIDHEVEVVPYKDKIRLSRLLVSLKGQALNDREHRVIEKIIKNAIGKEVVADY